MNKTAHSSVETPGETGRLAIPPLDSFRKGADPLHPRLRRLGPRDWLISSSSRAKGCKPHHYVLSSGLDIVGMRTVLESVSSSITTWTVSPRLFPHLDCIPLLNAI